MRKIMLFSVLFATASGLFFSPSASAQLVNDGAIITIMPGGSIFCGGNFENKNSATFTNNGKLEVQGNFLNSATYNTTTADDSLILSGGGNVTLNGGASSFTNLWINKTASSNFVTLTGTTLLTGKLDYTEGTFTTDPIANPSFLFSAPTSAVFNFAAGKEIIGRVRRTGWTNGSTRVFNQPNMQVTTAGGVAPTDFTVTMIPQSGGGDPSLNEREVKRKFLFAQTGGSGFTTDIRYPYLDAELNTNTEANLVPWQLITAEWNGRLTPITRDGINNYVSTTGLSTTDIANEWKLADSKYTFNITAYLRGAWNTGTLQMNTTLNTVLPLIQPYNDVAFGSYSGSESVAAGFFTTHTNIVDWVLIDFRKPVSGLPSDATASTFIGRKAAFVLNTGVVVDLDGVTPLAFDINKQGAGFAVVRHRNHLAVMSNSIPSNTSGTYTNDFSLLANAYDNIAITSDPMQALPSSTKYGLWAGNANKDATVNASDVGLVKANANVTLTGYVFGDVNMDQTVNAGDVGLTKVSANATAQSHAGRNNDARNIEPRTHVPN